ncbi:MAG: helix-turn-helix domain-containing protein [Marmoricola sp.]
MLCWRPCRPTSTPAVHWKRLRRSLFVHANTVRYRLKRVLEITGLQPLDARDAYILRVALTCGRLESL